LKLSADKINKILLINLAFIGDTILSTPVARGLKESYPQAQITMLTIPVAAPVAEMNPYIDKVICYDKKGRHKGFWGMMKMVQLLAREHFNLAVCMNFALRGVLVAWLARIKYRVGYDVQQAGWLLTHTTKPVRDGKTHETINHLQVLHSLGIEPTDTTVSFKLNQAAEASLAVKVKISADRPLVIICPYGSYPRKSLSDDKYVEIIKSLNLAADVYLIGGDRERLQLLTIADRAELTPEKVLAGSLNLQELAVFIKQARVLLSVDTGPMHMAQAVNTTVVALFGPTDPAVWGPRGARDILLFEKRDCSPCWGKGTCTKNDCMENFSAAEIVENVLLVINEDK